MSKIFSNFVPKLEAMNLYSTLFYVEVEGRLEKVEHLEYFETRKACVEFAQKLAKVLGALFWIQDRNQDPHQCNFKYNSNFHIFLPCLKQKNT